MVCILLMVTMLLWLPHIQQSSKKFMNDFLF